MPPGWDGKGIAGLPSKAALFIVRKEMLKEEEGWGGSFDEESWKTTFVCTLPSVRPSVRQAAAAAAPRRGILGPAAALTRRTNWDPVSSLDEH